MAAVLALVLALLAALPGDGWRVGPVPGWARPLEVPAPPASVPPPWMPRDFRVLLHDEQSDLRGAVPERFVHVATRLVDALDVREESHLEVLFDPADEEVVLHFVRRHRGGRVDDLLDPARVTTIQREPDLDLLLSDGQRTLLFFPEGVAKGDVLEVAYTVRGGNPVFDGHVLAALPLASGAGDVLLRQRVLTDPARDAAFVAHGVDVAPRVATLPDGARERVVERALVPPVPLEEGAPAWADELPWLDVSDFATWGDVIAWGRPLYALGAPSAELAALARRCERAAPDVEGRILSALRFVQDEVRYLGFELGPGSHRPRAPDAVLESRFGDCKDKSLLLTALLRELAVDAAPALVSTVLGEHVAAQLPSPWAFDHVVTRVRLDGSTFWLDATQLSERGPLAERAAAPFGRALVVADGERGLSDVPADPATTPDELVTLDLGVVSPEAPTTARWTAEYRREAANAVRRDLDWDGVEPYAADVQDDLARLDPGVALAQGPGVLDDESANRIQLSAAFRLAPLVHREGARQVLRLEAVGLAQLLAPAPSGARVAPLAVVHPVHAVYEARARPAPDFLARLDTGWMEPVRVEGPAAVLERDGRRDGDDVVLRWTYRTRSEAVPPEALDAHRAATARLRELLAAVLVAPDAASPAARVGEAAPDAPTLVLDAAAASEPNWTVLACGALAALASLLAAAWSGSRALRVAPRDDGRARPLLALGMALAAALPVAQLVGRRARFALPAWLAATTPGASDYHPGAAPALVLHVAGASFLAVQGLSVAARLLRGRPGALAAMGPVLVGLTLLVWADAFLLSWAGLGGNRIEAGMLTAFCGALSLCAHARRMALPAGVADPPDDGGLGRAEGE